MTGAPDVGLADKEGVDEVRTDSFALGGNFLEFFQSEKVGLGKG